jgi:hypothetical protein
VFDEELGRRERKHCLKEVNSRFAHVIPAVTMPKNGRILDEGQTVFITKVITDNLLIR